MIEPTSESTIRKVLKNEAVVVMAIISAVFSFVMFVVVPQQRTATDIALIQASIKKIEENHLTHLQTYAEEIKIIKQDIKEDESQQTELMKEIIKLNTKIELTK